MGSPPFNSALDENTRLRLLAAVVESSDDAIVSKTLNGIITSWNRAAEQIFGYTAEEIIGQSILTLIPKDRQHEETLIQDKLRHGERIDHYETVRVRKDGREIDVSVTVSPVRNGNGDIIGASKIARDITERKHLEQELLDTLERERAARTTAEHATRLRDEFLATVSHELRTPLNSILGWGQLLRRTPEDEETRTQALDSIERGARAQARLIDDLLDMSRIISGKLRLEVQSVELPVLIQSSIETIRPAAEAKHIRVEQLLDPLAGPIKGDPARLQQILWNLLSNAVKFTPKGGLVQVHLERVNSHIEISVSDTGQGIAPEYLPHVFDRFSQADSSTTRKYGGLGLGLAVVKHLAEMHGGRAWARSPGAGQGATFSVHLPVAVVQQDTIGREHPVAPRLGEIVGGDVDLDGVRVLVVDDDPEACEMLRRVLQEHRAVVTRALSADEALEELERWKPDVLVSDVGMPLVDGYELIRRVRARGNLLPAVAVTAFARAEDRIRALRAGYNMHVAKPLEPWELIEVVAALARARRSL